MDIENPSKALQNLSICTLLKAIQDCGDDIILAEQCITSIAMYRGIVEPLQISEFYKDYKNDVQKYQLTFQFSPEFLLHNYGFYIGGGARLQWKIFLPKLADYDDLKYIRKNSNAINWIKLCRMELTKKDQFNVDEDYFNATIKEYLF